MVKIMKTITLDEIQKLGGHLLPDGKLNFRNSYFVKGGSFPQNSLDFIESMVKKYQESGVECLLVTSNGLVTIWRMENKVEVSPRSNPTLSTKKFVIAHIDDSSIEHKTMSSILEKLICDYVPITNPMLAVSSLLKIKPSLIFLDLNMPIVNGYEICTQLRRVDMFKDTPVVIVTGNDGFVDRVRAKMAGATDFISKPIDREKVVAILNKYLQIEAA